MLDYLKKRAVFFETHLVSAAFDRIVHIDALDHIRLCSVS